jgi:serine/threonine-protein kinase
MSLFANYRADRLIAELKSSGSPGSPVAQKTLEKLVALGSDAIEPIVDALATSEKRETTAYVEALARLIDAKTLPSLLKIMSEANGRAMSGIAWALSSSKNYPPHALLDALSKPDMPKQALLDVISAQKTRYTVRELLNAAYTQEPNERNGLFKIIGEIADESSVDDLVARIEGKDPVARLHIINVLARFNLPKVQQAVQKQLKDSSKFIRSAALSALAKMDGTYDMPLLVGMLRDPEIEVQNKAVDVVVKVNHPETIKYLVDVLKDENEYARRAAVEVLNVVGTSKSVKYLLEIIADSDWWVRTRAADALGKIGGPRVVDAVLALIKDENQDIRRAAIEILNQTKDERAVAQLIEATRDPDWWVSERAVDALAEIGSTKALPRFIDMLQGEAKSLPTVIRAIGKIGDQKSLEALLPMLSRPENEIKVEAIAALAKLADERRADTIRVRLQAVSAASPEGTLSQAVARAIQELDNRFSTQQLAANQRAERMQEPAKTLLVDNPPALANVAKQSEDAAATAKLDIATLKTGDIIEGRYKYIEKIGKGAFGTVLLMEDTVVEERLILKFLNANVSSDEEMMKRFVHELRYSRKITHKNVIRIYDFLYIKGNYAISMEYFPSHTLGGEIVNEKPVELKRAVKFAIDIATGMAVAHQAGIVHRDLKPANVLIDNDLLLKIVDFGVAAAQTQGDTQLTKTGYVIGSPKYMAPEQILGKKVDERADIYSLGIIMYEMFAGVPPYSRGDHMSVMYQHVQGKARQPIEINKQLPVELNSLVMKCMSLDKSKRAQSMDELRLSLEKFL